MSTSQILRVRDWEEIYEWHSTIARPFEPMRWVKIPVKEGSGFLKLVSHRRGAAHLGCWLAIVQVAATCFPRGVLADSNGRALGPLDLSRRKHLPSRDFEEVIPRLLDEADVGWLETITREELEVLRTHARERAPAQARTSDRASARRNTRQQETTRDKKEQGASAGAEGAAPPSTKVRKPTNPIDDEWLDGLQKDYPHLDVRFVYRKMYRWCEVHNKIPSRKRMINWVNSEDKPMTPPSGTHPPGATPPSIRPRKVIGG